MDRYCRCPDAHCLDQGIQCGECDEDGYPPEVRRRLKRRADGDMQDFDGQQVYRVKKTKTGDRLVPKFAGRIDWKGAQGFAAMLLILSCLGAEGEYVLWDSEKDKEMDVEEWKRRKYKNVGKPPIRHSTCKEIISSTMINSLTTGQAIGCRCHSVQKQHWRHRREEIVTLGKHNRFEVLTTAAEWLQHCDCREWRPQLRCQKCGDDNVQTTIHELIEGCLGCKCRSTQMRHWRHRREEIVKLGKENQFEVLTTVEEWFTQCKGFDFCPQLRCLHCKMIVTSTCVSLLRRRHNVGCKCHSTMAKHWRNRRDEVVQWGTERGFVVETSEKEWLEKCDGMSWKPSLRCITCSERVCSTTVRSLYNGQSIGCTGCHHKTEGKLYIWLQKRCPEASVTPQCPGPTSTAGTGGRTHFDFHLQFPDGFEVLIELDGAQHFWVHKKYFTDAGCERDMVKEEWAVQHGLCVVRVLQEDVWSDRLDWQGWLVRSIEAARTGEPRVLTPDAPEYRSSESAYVRLRV